MQFLTSTKLTKVPYVPGVKGFAKNFPIIGPYRKESSKQNEKTLPPAPKINELKLKDPRHEVRYNEELKQLRYQYLKETFDDNQKDQKVKKSENVDGLVGPRRIRKQIVLKYPEDQMTVLKRNALMIDQLLEERLKILIIQRDSLILEHMKLDESGKPYLTDTRRSKIEVFLRAQIGTAPDVLKTHLDKFVDIESILMFGLRNPNWTSIQNNALPKDNDGRISNKLNNSRLKALLSLFHASESFVTPSNIDKITTKFAQDADFELPSELSKYELNPHKTLDELMEAIIENGVIPTKVDNHTGGVDSPAIGSRSIVMKRRALNLFQEESLQQAQNMGSQSAYNPDTANLTINAQQDLNDPNVSGSAPSIPLHRQKMPRREKYAFNETDVVERRLTENGDDSLPNYSMSKEDAGFVELPQGDVELLKNQRTNELLDSYKGTINGKFGIQEVLNVMKAKKE